jgi:hypothetical protein
MARNQILAAITDFYLASPRFNGMSLRELELEADPAAAREAVSALVLEGSVAAVFGDSHPNSHIRAFPERHSPEKQVELLNDGKRQPCFYPLRKHLERVVDAAQYEGAPYTLELALGEPQLVHRAFDLSVLEMYRNDPRYSYSSDDIHGSLCIHDDAVVPKHDEVYLRFGFALDDALNKYVAAFLWDLHKLSPEHQRLWKMREVRVATKLHPDYFRSSILGEFPERMSIYQALVEELQVVNRMAVAMGRQRFFREDYEGQPPRGFSSLLRPTLREFNEFVLMLDKMLSDNINKAFFHGDVPDFERREHDDGSFERISRGTLSMLEDWLKKRFSGKDDTFMVDLMNGLREVRKLRQKPAHTLREDEFDQAYIHQQRDLMKKAYLSVRTLRLVFANHPASRTIEVPEWLFKGDVWAP